MFLRFFSNTVLFLYTTFIWSNFVRFKLFERPLPIIQNAFLRGYTAFLVQYYFIISILIYSNNILWEIFNFMTSINIALKYEEN